MPSSSTSTTSPGRICVVVPGVPESNRAYLLSPAGLRPLPSKRIAGGIRIVLEPDDDGFVLMTEDQQVVAALRRRTERTGLQAVRLQRELAVGRLASVVSTGERLQRLGYKVPDEGQIVAAAKAQIGRCDTLLATGNVERAYQAAGAARRTIGQIADRQRGSVLHPNDLISSPLAASPDTLVQQAALLKSLESLPGDKNLLYGGDFEDLAQLMQFGWQHVDRSLAGVETQAELSARDPYHGRYCLQLSAGDGNGGRPSQSDGARAPAR